MTEELVQCPACLRYRERRTKCLNGCFEFPKEEKQMGGEWFEWNENEWVNVTKSMRLKVDDMSDWEFKIPENLDWRVQGEKGYGFYFIRDFSTKDEALAFARDFMAKNGGIIE